MGVSDETLRRMNEAFGNIFDMRYFRGQSDHFLLEPQEKSVEPPQERVKNDPQPIDHSSLINAMLAAKDETIAALREQIQAKDELIAALRQQLDILQQQVHAAKDEELFKDFPFPKGIADKKDKPSAHV